MAKNFAQLAFTDAVKALQDKFGSRASYARMERDRYDDGLTNHERAFIAERDSFYMASFGANDYPYIQHRGGPKGFLKVLDAKSLAFLDFKGNMQYISSGNIVGNPNVALILVDYPSKTRLKILAKAEVVALADRPELWKQLEPAEYQHKPEQIMILHVEAFDWNCPQHITPRYTIEDIAAAFDGQRKQIDRLESEVARLKQKLTALGA